MIIRRQERKTRCAHSLLLAFTILGTRNYKWPATTLGFVLWGRSVETVSAQNIVVPRLTTLSKPYEAAAPLLKPYKPPYDSGYFTHHPEMPGETTVDGDGTGRTSDRAQLYFDVGIHCDKGSLSVGARCDSSAMDAHDLDSLCDW